MKALEINITCCSNFTLTVVLYYALYLRSNAMFHAMKLKGGFEYLSLGTLNFLQNKKYATSINHRKKKHIKTVTAMKP